MTSLCRKINGSANNHFLKIIPKGTSCRDSKLGIPKKFLMKYGDELSNPVFLKLPSGNSKWKVELRRWDGEAWFGNGWPEFSEFCSLDYWHSLVFRYEGNSNFRVCIFDRSFTEIDYPLVMPQTKETNEDDSSVDSGNDEFGDDANHHSGDACDDSVKITDKCPARTRKTRKKSPLPCPQPLKKNRTSSSGNVDFPAKRQGVGKSSTPKFLKRTQTVLGRMHPTTANAKAIALQRAKAFVSDNPSFRVPMYSSYIHHYLLCLPSDFSLHVTHLSKHSGNCILRVLGGRTWSVGFTVRRRAMFQSGWMEFVRGNDLKVGDVCVFVLIDNITPKFDVVIFRANEAATCNLSPDGDREQTMPTIEETDEDDDYVDSLDEFQPFPKNGKCFSIRRPESNLKDVCGSSRTQKLLKGRHEVSKRMNLVKTSGKDIALHRANAFKSKYPSFKVAIRPSNIRGRYLLLPAEFVQEHLNQAHDNAILCVPKGRSWPVNLCHYARGGVRFQGGFTTFMRDNHLEIGDVCVFVFIDGIRIKFKVVIFRADEAANVDGKHIVPKIEETDEDDILDDFQPFPKNRTCSSISKAENNIKDVYGSSGTRKFLKGRHEVPRRMHPVMESGKDIALQRANAFKSKYPSFKAAIRPANLLGCYLSFPAEFVHKYLNQTHHNAILRVSDEGTWHVKLGHYRKGVVRMQSGWVIFVRDNHLETGDVCVFELINNIKPSFDVVLFRARHN